MPTEILGMLKVSISPEINALGALMIVITVGCRCSEARWRA
jgi:spermidine/putrescine transport system permease protein